MTDGQQLFNTLLRAAEGTRKEGYTATNANVTMTTSSANDVANFTVVIPIGTAVTAAGESKVVAKDWLTFQPLEA
jgi:3D (Asp-Asp-Asp) domain-containing protein